MNRPRRGFTLIEVLVALVVAVAAFSILAQGFSTGARASTTAQAATRAALVAGRVIAGVETGELTMNQSHSGAFEDEPDFKYESKAENYETGVTKITVAVKWDDRGQERTYELVRLFRERTQTP